MVNEAVAAIVILSAGQQPLEFLTPQFKWRAAVWYVPSCDDTRGYVSRRVARASFERSTAPSVQILRYVLLVLPLRSQSTLVLVRFHLTNLGDHDLCRLFAPHNPDVTVATAVDVEDPRRRTRLDPARCSVPSERSQSTAHACRYLAAEACWTPTPTYTTSRDTNRSLPF